MYLVYEYIINWINQWMDKQQYSYHLLSYDIILINFPQPPQPPKKRWNEISQMPMNHPHLHSLPQCLKLLHWSELRGPMNCQANGTTCHLSWYSTTRNLKKEPTCIILRFYGLPEKNLRKYLWCLCIAMMFFCNDFFAIISRISPQNLRSYWTDICIHPSLRFSNQTSPQEILCFSSTHETPPPQENHPFKKASNNPKCEPPLEDQVPPAYHLNGKWAWQFCAIK